MLNMWFMSWSSLSKTFFYFVLSGSTPSFFCWSSGKWWGALLHGHTAQNHQAIVLSLTTHDSTIQSVQQAANGQVKLEPGPLQSGLCPCDIYCWAHKVLFLAVTTSITRLPVLGEGSLLCCSPWGSSRFFSPVKGFLGSFSSVDVRV